MALIDMGPRSATVRCTADASQLTGPGFDPGASPSPTLGQNVYRHHGRGIYLINQLRDEVSFENGGTEALITDPPNLERAIKRETGTWITKS